MSIQSKTVNKLPQVYVLLLFIILSLIAFYQTIPSGFVYDFLSWARHYAYDDIFGAIKTYEHKSLHPVLHVINYALYNVFGFNGFAWYLIFSSLHAFNAFLLFKFLYYLLNLYQIKHAFVASVLAGTLFILHPNNVEPVVWKVCIHYLLTLSGVLFSLYCLTVFLIEGRSRYYITAVVIYVITLFMLEMTYMIPFLWPAYALMLNYTYLETRWSFLKISIYFFVIPLTILVGYIGLTYLLKGSPIGHYGAETHLNFDVFFIIQNAFNYLTKHLFFGRFFNFYDSDLYTLLTSLVGLVIFTFILIALGCLLFFYIKKIPKNFLLAYSFLIFFFISLLPILNLFFSTMLLSENDRYGYVASPFLIAALILLFVQFKSHLKWIPVFIYLVVSIFFFRQTTEAWKYSGVISTALIEDFNAYAYDEIFFLNTPDNFQGVYMFSVLSSDRSIFNRGLELMKGKEFEGKIWDVAQYTMRDKDNTIAIQSDTTNHLRVTFAQWGSWWIKNSYGATDYENERYRFELGFMAYDVYFKGDLDSSKVAIMYHEGKKWKKVNIADVLSAEPVKINEHIGVH